MIIFDLDGTLADCEHRRHFVDPKYHPDFYIDGKYAKDSDGKFCDQIGKRFKPDWQAFYEACDKDTPIEPVMRTFSRYWIGEKPEHVEIWSGRCESVRDKTVKWFLDNWFFGLFDHEKEALKKIIKMRPIGDDTPDPYLWNKWLDEINAADQKVEMIFTPNWSIIQEFRKLGIFVFDVSQRKGEF